MSDCNQLVESLLNEAASLLPLVDATELGMLAKIGGCFDQIAAMDSLPKAFCTLAKRASQLADHIIMAETDLDSGLKKINTSIDKMRSCIPRSAESATQPKKEKTSKKTGSKTVDVDKDVTADADIPDDIKDLIVKFAAGQSAVLEDFEAYILEFEKDNPQAKGAIKRVLHTWKGEFGVLSMPEYSAMIHKIEDAIENNEFSTDSLFKLKDFFAEKFMRAANGDGITLQPQEVAALLEKSDAPQKSAPEALPTLPIAQSKDAPAVTATAVDSQEGFIPRDLGVDPSILADFVTEAMDHIRTSETLLLELENNPTDAESLNCIFRACHTVKGTAGFLNLKEVQSFAHSMENLMDAARTGKLTLQAQHIDLLLESMDVLKEFMKILEDVLAGGTYSIPAAYNAVFAKLKSPNATAQHAIIDPPVASEKKLGEILLDKGVVNQAQVNEALSQQMGGDDRKLGEILIDNNEIPARTVAGALATQNAAKKAVTVEDTIRVPVNRIDQLVDSIGEAVIAQSMVYADPAIKSLSNLALEKKMAQAALIMRQIQELSMSLRMVSIKSTFQKMARLVRDLAKKMDKEVELVLEGEDTELDKSVVENIGDPLIHMIRNALDHGIEGTAEARVAAGKSVKATVTLRAFHRAGNVVIEIGDDGKGLNRDVILSKAREKGLVKENQSFTDQEIYQFIFLPGFSTAAVVTDVSGRGVGMDVVRRNIEALRGSVDIQTEIGKGTTFSIRLPLTLAIINGMIIRVDDERYIVPTLSIVESLRPTEEQVKTAAGKAEMILIRGSLVRFLRLAQALGKKEGIKNVSDGVGLIVEDTLGRRVCLLVNEILDQQQVVIKSLGTSLGELQGLSGGAIMNDGTVSLILDVGGVMKLAEAD